MAPDALRFAVRLSVLVIADHSGMGKMLDDFLTGEGYDVALLAEPSLATKGIRNAAFHLIILDLAMPKIDGLTLVRADPRAQRRH